MRYRKLRITWTVICRIACLLLIVLWVRSYSWFDLVILSPRYGMVSAWGGIDMTPVRIPPSPLLRRLVSMQGTKANYAPPDYSLIGFGYAPTPSSPRICIPYWFPVLLVAIGTLPWLGASARFSLRSLLIAITAVALILDLAVWAARS